MVNLGRDSKVVADTGVTGDKIPEARPAETPSGPTVGVDAAQTPNSAPITPAPTHNSSDATPTKSTNNPNTAQLGTVAPTSAQKATDVEKTYINVTSQYAIKLETRVVADPDSGVLYARYKPNWFFNDEVKLGINDKQLLTTADATSSDRTAQVIFNLADTALNVAKLYAGGGFNFAARQTVSAAPTTRAVVYKKLHVDVTFDPFDDAAVARLKRLFQDDWKETTVYVSPFTVDLNYLSADGDDPARIVNPKAGKGLCFREPIAVEVLVIGRERHFLQVVNDEIRNSPKYIKPGRGGASKNRMPVAQGATGNAAPNSAFPPAVGNEAQKSDQLTPGEAIEAQSGDNAEQEAHDRLLAELKALYTNSGDHTERFVSTIPNKNRVFAYNITRSAFVQNKTTTLSITDGQLSQVHIVKPSEAEGFTQIPLTLSQKVLALPKDLLTYRKELITGRTDVNTAELGRFNSEESLKNATAAKQYTEQTALVNAESASIQAKAAQVTAETNLLSNGLTQRQTQETLSIQADIARLRAEAARLDAEAAVLKSRAALEAAKP